MRQKKSCPVCIHIAPSCQRDPLSNPPSQIVAAAEASNGFVGADLQALVSQTGLAALRRYHAHQQASSTDAVVDDCLRASTRDLQVARTRVKASALREIVLEIPRVRWDDIGGLEDVKQRLKEAVELPFKKGNFASTYGAVAPKGGLAWRDEAALLWGADSSCSQALLE